MKKRNKVLIVILVIVIAGVMALIVANYTSLSFVKFQCENYLSQKYDADKSEFELIDYKKFHSYVTSDNILEFNLEWTDFSFEYKYNDRLFFVNRIDGKFHDDYQIDDVENWCTEWLKENVDERITAIEISSGLLWSFCENYKEDNLYVINSNDAFDLISYSSDYRNYFMIYYSVESSVNNSNEKEVISEKFDEKFGNDNFAAIVQQSGSVYKTRGKNRDSFWYISINDYE